MRYLKSKWKIILLAGIVGGLLGFLYAKFKKPVYTAECTFVLEEESKGGLGQYAGLASMVGIDLGSMGGSSGLFQGDNIIELYKSRLMLQKTLLTEADFNGKKELLINRYIDFNKLRERWAKDPKVGHVAFEKSQSKLSIKQDSIIGDIVKIINKKFLTVEKPDKKLSIISVKFESKDELFAKAFTDELVENVNSFYVQTKTKKSTQNLQILEKQADSVRRVLNYAIGGVAASIDANPNANEALRMLQVPSQRRQIDVQASSAIYAEIVKNLELAKVSLRRETPLIQVIDKPVLPLEKNQTGIFESSILCIFLFIILEIMIVTALRLKRNIG